MLVESLAIIVVILLLAFMAVRSEKFALAKLTVPLIFLSVFHLIGEGAQQLFSIGPTMYPYFLLGAHIIGLLLSVLFCILASRSIAGRRIRMFYLLLTTFFLIALFIAYQL